MTTRSSTAAFRAVVNRRQVTRALAGAAIGVVVGLLTVLAWVRKAPLIDEWELVTVDLRLAKFREPARVSDGLAVVTIDDLTEQQFKQASRKFPPDRAALEELITDLEMLHPRAVVLDYLFDTSGDLAHGAARFAATQSGSAAADAEAAATARLSQTLWSEGHGGFGLRTADFPASATSEQVREMTEADAFLDAFLRARLPAVEHRGRVPPRKTAQGGLVPHLYYPAAPLLAGARVLGLTDVADMRDSDERVRRFHPFVSVDGFDIPALGLAAIAAGDTRYPDAGAPEWPDGAPPKADAWPALEPAVYAPGVVTIGGRRIPIREDGTAWIRWRGDWERDPELKARTISAASIYDAADALAAGNAPAAIDRVLRDKVVLVGLTAHGEFTDKLASPFGYTPGVFAHAAVIDTVLSGDYLRSPPRELEEALLVLLSAVVGALVLGLPQFRWAKRFGNVSAVATLVIIGAVPLVLWTAIAAAAFSYGWVMNAVPANSSGVATLIVAVSTAVAVARRSEDQALAIANRALSPQLVARYQRENDGMPPLGGEKVKITVYFSDIAGFTTLSEKIPPEEMVAILNEYLTRVTELLENAHHAYITGYIGDAVMAIWGAPVPAEDSAVRACLAALDTMKAMEAYSRELEARGFSGIKTRVGINTGLAVAAAVGHPRGKFNYTALGDTVNSGSRLEGANKAFGTRCMLGEQTYAEVKDVILARELDLLRMKGKHIATHVYELIGKQSDPFPREREIKRRYEAALARYRAREFAAARAEFAALVTEFDDSPSKTLVRRCDERIAAPPPADWDGSNELTEK